MELEENIICILLITADIIIWHDWYEYLFHKAF